MHFVRLFMNYPKRFTINLRHLRTDHQKQNCLLSNSNRAAKAALFLLLQLLFINSVRKYCVLWLNKFHYPENFHRNGRLSVAGRKWNKCQKINKNLCTSETNNSAILWNAGEVFSQFVKPSWRLICDTAYHSGLVNSTEEIHKGKTFDTSKTSSIQWQISVTYKTNRTMINRATEEK